MKGTRLLIAASLAALTQAAWGAVRVVTTTPDLASIVAAVGGKNVTVSALVAGARDPHRIEAKPSYMSRVANADLFLAIGLDLEAGYERPILEGSRNAKVRVGGPRHFYASQWAVVIDKPTGNVTRAMGDIHPMGNPHIWLDPYNGRLIAIRVADILANIDPRNAASYASNVNTFVRKLDSAMFGAELVERFGGNRLWEWERAGQLVQRLQENNARGALGGWSAKMLPFRGASVITYHRSLNYFTSRFDLRVVEELEPKPGLDPTPGHLAEVIQRGKAAGVKAILQESFYPVQHARLVAGRIGANVVVIPQNVGHDRAAQDYISLFNVIVDRISGALR